MIHQHGCSNEALSNKLFVKNNTFLSGYLQTGILANSKDPDEMRHNAAFHQGLYCLQKQIFKCIII